MSSRRDQEYNYARKSLTSMASAKRSSTTTTSGLKVLSAILTVILAKPRTSSSVPCTPTRRGPVQSSRFSLITALAWSQRFPLSSACHCCSSTKEKTNRLRIYLSLSVVCWYRVHGGLSNSITVGIANQGRM